MKYKEQIAGLTSTEQALLIKAPALVSVLAATTDNEISDKERNSAIELAHLKTLTHHPLLKAYYESVEPAFKNNFESTIRRYAPFDNAKREALEAEIKQLEPILLKLDPNLAQLLHKSLSSYADHVRKSNLVVLDSFIFPLEIPGLTG